MRTYAIVNRKGGVGKTTTAINLAYILATSCQQRVLLIDADSQGNATNILLPKGEYGGLGAVLRGAVSYYGDVIEHTDVPWLDVVPASEDLWSIDLEQSGGTGGFALQSLRDLRDSAAEDNAYDVLVIDCPPNFSTACVAAIAAATGIIIPVLPDAFSVVGMADLVQQIDSVRRIHPDVRVAGCLVNQWHRADVVTDSVEYLREESPVPVYHTVIRRTDKVLESTWAGVPVQVWSPFSGAARDYRAWVAELCAQEGINYGQV